MVFKGGGRISVGKTGVGRGMNRGMEGGRCDVDQRMERLVPRSTGICLEPIPIPSLYCPQTYTSKRASIDRSEETHWRSKGLL